jgi:hypothetical protein
MQDYHARKRNAPDVKTLVKRAIDELYGDRLKTLARQEERQQINKQASERMSQFSARPVHRHTNEPDDLRTRLTRGLREIRARS